MARAYRCADGTVSIMYLNERHRVPGQTDEAFYAQEAAKAPRLAGATVIGDVDPDALPPRRFRACWRQSGNGVAVDLPLARAQRMTEIRAERTRRLVVTDGEILRARDLGDARAEQALTTYRQALRDLPAVAQPVVDAATTADDLAAYEPDWPVTS